MSTFEEYFKLGAVKQRVEEHERRLNDINGSIDGLREDVDGRMSVFEDKLTNFLVWAKVAFILGQILTPVIVGVIVYMLFR